METVYCYTGGVSQGNPGLAAIGVSITDVAHAMLGETAHTIGNSTDTFAAYQAVLVGLQTLKDILDDASVVTEVVLYLENESVKKQLNAETPITEPGFVPLFIEIHNMRVEHFPHLSYRSIASTENTVVAGLLNEALGGV